MAAVPKLGLQRIGIKPTVTNTVPPVPKLGVNKSAAAIPKPAALKPASAR